MRSALIGLAYFLAASASIRFTRFDGGVALIWAASALLIVELSLRPARTWAATLSASATGSMAATTTFGLGLSVAPLIALAMIAEAAMAAWLLRRVRAGRLDLGSLEGVVIFAIVAGLIAPAAGAAGGAAVVDAATGTGFWWNWLGWYAGHALGNIILAPILVLVLRGEFAGKVAGLEPHRRLEAIALSAAMIGITALVFAQTAFPVLFLPMLPMMIAAFRFGRFGSAVAILLLALVGGAFTLGGSGPVQLIHASSGGKIMFFQFYLLIAAFMTLPVAAVLQQRAALFRALRESEARYRLITDGSSDVILNLDREGRIRYVSPSVAELAGYDAAAMIGINVDKLVVPEDRSDAAATHARALADPGATFIVEYRALTALGAAIWCESHTRGVTDDHGRVIGAVSQIRNISHHKSVEAELSRAAHTDALTGLVNRRVFDDALDGRIAQVRGGMGLGVCAILDLDFFKRINDRHGHDSGDRVLRLFARVAAASIREGDLIARLGGEEFGLILWGADLSAAHAICDRLRREIAALAVTTEGGAEIGFTFSGGLARISDGLTRDEILREADEALYRAKHGGRNRLALAA